MNISAPFIHPADRHHLVDGGLSVVGLVAYALLPIAGRAPGRHPTVQVHANLPGASAETMATSVAAPLERQLGLISGVTTLSSSSSLGQTSITVEFALDRSPLTAPRRTSQTAINAASGDLPTLQPADLREGQSAMRS